MVRGRWRAKTLDRPARCVDGNRLTELPSAIVCGTRQRGQVGLPLRVVNLGYPLGEGLANRVEAHPINDAGLQDAGDLAGIVKRSSIDRVGQYLLRVVAGQFDPAQQT